MSEYQFQDALVGLSPKNLLFMGGYYGLALMSVVFNLVFYIIFKNKSFIAYCILLFSTAITFFYEDGLFYFLSDGKWIMPHLTMWNSSLTAVAALLFTYYFLELDSELAAYRKVFFIATGVLSLGVVLHIFTQIPLISHFVLSTCFVFALTCLYLAVKRFKKDIYARFLTIAFGLLVFTGMFYALHTRTDYAIFSWFNINVFRLFSTLEIISISFAIIFRVKTLQQENEFYREELNKYLRDLDEKRFEEIIDENNQTEQFTEILEKKYSLTEREIQVLQCIWEGMSNKEISEQLFISLSTTKYHISNLYIKLDVKNRHQAVVLTQFNPVSNK